MNLTFEVCEDNEWVDKFVEDIERKRKECDDAGEHRNVVEMPYTVSSRSDSLRDRVYSTCTYCLTFMDRSLNVQERRAIADFREMIREPITI